MKFSKPINQFKKTVPEGRYVLEIEKIEEGKSQSSGNDMFTFQFDISEGENKYAFFDKPLKFYISKDPDGIWEKKLAGLLCMIRESNNLPTNIQEFKPEEYINLKVGAFIELKDETWKTPKGDEKQFKRNKIKYFCRIDDINKENEIKEPAVSKLSNNGLDNHLWINNVPSEEEMLSAVTWKATDHDIPF